MEKSLVKASLADYETLLGPDGRAFSDQTAKLKIMVSSMENGGYVGLLLKGRTLEYPELAGVLVAFDGKETVISHKGEVIARADCAFGMGKMITVEVETRGDVFTVRAGGEVIVSCEIPDAPPVGATQFIANYSLATIYDFAVIPE